MTIADSNIRPEYDALIQELADYVCNTQITSQEAYQTAHYCLLDSLGCAALALSFSECTKLLGPWVPGTVVPQGVKVPGTSDVLDPVKAAFDIGTLVRWLDFNDTWLAAEWGHPSDNLGAILSVVQYQSQKLKAEGKEPLKVKDILTAMIKAHEIQGVLALENSFNRVGLDHVILVKVASTAVVTALLGGGRQDVMNALSQAFVDGQSLRTYRHAPNAGSRKSWAAGDATSRAVQLALFTLKGEKGYPSALTAKTWGFQDVLFKGKEVVLPQKLASYVMENVLFKISFPAEFHAQTAVEAACQLYPEVKDKWQEIQSIHIKTHESAIRIINKTGPLHNPADRDHSLQYMVAIALLTGNLTADDYEDSVAKNPLVDALREKMIVTENKSFSHDYLDPEKRSIANTLQVEWKDGTRSQEVTVEYPIGHASRRKEGIPVLMQKFERNMARVYSEDKWAKLKDWSGDKEGFSAISVLKLMDCLSKA